jgi:hypothetical protein
VRAAIPKLDKAGVAATLEGTVASQGAWTKDVAFGAINVAAAVQRATEGTPPTVSPAVVTSMPKDQKARPRAVTTKSKRVWP